MAFRVSSELSTADIKAKPANLHLNWTKNGVDLTYQKTCVSMLYSGITSR